MASMVMVGRNDGVSEDDEDKTRAGAVVPVLLVLAGACV